LAYAEIVFIPQGVKSETALVRVCNLPFLHIVDEKIKLNKYGYKRRKNISRRKQPIQVDQLIPYLVNRFKDWTCGFG
jgi:hypothetical protein